MKKTWCAKRVVMFSFLLLAPLSNAVASEAQGQGQPAAELHRFEKVGGDYKVKAVKKLREGAFLIEFESTLPTGRFDKLRLESDHVHVAVKEGENVRLSAEILSVNGDAAEVAQVVLFLPNSNGRVPVWLLSKKAPAGELRASKYLEMHAPMNDYMVM